MAYQLLPRIGRIHSIIFAIGLCSLFVSGAKAQHTTWTIKVDGTGSRLKPGYSVVFTPPTGGCPYATLPLDPENLMVCQGDIVKWVAPGE